MRESGLWVEAARRGGVFYAGILRLAARSRALSVVPFGGGKARGEARRVAEGTVPRSDRLPVRRSGVFVPETQRFVALSRGISLARHGGQSSGGGAGGIHSVVLMSGNVVHWAGRSPGTWRASENLGERRRERVIMPEAERLSVRRDSAGGGDPVSLPQGRVVSGKSARNQRFARMTGGGDAVPPSRKSVASDGGELPVRETLAGWESWPAKSEKSFRVTSSSWNEHAGERASAHLQARSAVTGPDEIRNPQFPGQSIGVS